VSRNTLCSTYVRVKMMTLSKEEGHNNAKSMRKGSPNPMMKSWIYWVSVSGMSRQEREMKRLQKSSMVPVCHNMANSPIGLFMRGGPKRAFINWMNCGHVGWPPLSSMR
jgi:hypothetical protein